MRTAKIAHFLSHFLGFSWGFPFLWGMKRMILLSVALGGALGALARYGISQIPFLSNSIFPWMTLVANLIGAVIIGFIAGAMWSSHALTPHQLALFKTGFCGSLTTFSTFSLEAISLFERGHWGLGLVYMTSSLVLSLGGVLVGRAVAMHCL